MNQKFKSLNPKRMAFAILFLLPKIRWFCLRKLRQPCLRITDWYVKPCWNVCKRLFLATTTFCWLWGECFLTYIIYCVYRQEINDRFIVKFQNVYLMCCCCVLAGVNNSDKMISEKILDLTNNFILSGDSSWLFYRCFLLRALFSNTTQVILNLVPLRYRL